MLIKKKELFFLAACFVWIAPIHLPNSFALLLRFLLLCGIFYTQYEKMNVVLTLSVLFAGLTLLSTVLFDWEMGNFLKTFSVMTAFVECVLCVSNPQNLKAMPKGLLKGFLIYFFIDAFFIFVLNGIGINANGQPLFFSGGKFNVCYMYMVLLVLIFLNYEQIKAWKKIALLIFGLFLAKVVDCNTGMLGILAFGATMFLPEFVKKGKRKYLWLGAMLLMHYLICIVQIQSTNPVIQYFITNILHRQVHLTGRVEIYNRIGEIMDGHWLLGHGYTSTRIVEVTKLANTQNGFLQIIYVGGIVLLVVFGILLLYLLYCLTKIENRRASNILFAALMGFLTIAIVEIPFSSVVFYIFIGIIYGYYCKEKGEKNVC